MCGRRLCRAAVVLGCGLACAVGCRDGRKYSAAADPPTGQTRRVTIDNFTFSPAELSVPVGTTVVWVNHDDVPHTVVEVSRQFSSPALDTDVQYVHAFTAAGTYDYVCGIHPHMTGRVVVK
jgi:plastocyanin